MPTPPAPPSPHLPAQAFTKAKTLINSKPPVSAGPAKLAKWWGEWFLLGEMLQPTELEASIEDLPLAEMSVAEDEKNEDTNDDSHWAKWWESSTRPSSSSFSKGTVDPSLTKLKITVLGAGSFGTCMATAAARNGHDVVMYCRDAAQAAHITKEHVNPKYLTQFTLPSNISATSDLYEACLNTSLIIHALPCQLTPDWLSANKHIIPDNVCICSTAKGLYVPTKQLLGDAMIAALGRKQPLAFLSGPSFAAEIMKGDPSAVVVASKKLYHATAIQRLLSSISLRIYTSQDIVGVQLGGALKNPLAVGAGMIEGLGLGINTMSAFVARSAGELTQLCIAMGGDPVTISGLSGVGDLMLTAFGNLSRNRTCGMRLVQGEKLEEILRTTTVEGVPTAAVAVYYADMCGLECPLFRMADAIINGRINPDQARAALMSRPLRHE